MKPKHTPGPWSIYHSKFGPEVRTDDVNADQRIAVCHYATTLRADCEDMESGEHEANARLIAAAPDLLASLKELIPLWSSGIDEPWVKRAKEAIAKACGQT